MRAPDGGWPEVAPPARGRARALQPEIGARATSAVEAIAPTLVPAHGVYARVGRPCFLGALVLLGLPVAIALAALVAPVNLVVHASPRRILFRQPRVGLRGRVFSIWKFRTMREPRRGAHASWSNGEDALRVTRFGRFLRSSHLDELPQVWNVLRGDMDLIGPRPEMVEVDAWARTAVPGFADRLVVRPGLTGLAQITQGYTGNDAEAYAEKLRIDREYLRTRSFAVDASIVLRTLAWMLRGRGWGQAVIRPICHKSHSAE